MRLEDMKNKPKAGTCGIRRTAFIESAGIPHPTYTMHSFIEARLAPDPEKGWLHPQWDLMYKCDVTKAERKFGVVDATDITEREQRGEEGLS